MALVVLLRGVNVGGHRTFRPTVLAKELADLDVVNIGAAGSFVIRQPVTQARVRAELARRLPFDAEIMIRFHSAAVNSNNRQAVPTRRPLVIDVAKGASDCGFGIVELPDRTSNFITRRRVNCVANAFQFAYRVIDCAQCFL